MILKDVRETLNNIQSLHDSGQIELSTTQLMKLVLHTEFLDVDEPEQKRVLNAIAFIETVRELHKANV